MKIVKRVEVCAPCTASLWFMPTMTYLIMKLNNIVSFHREWIWWVGIPTLILGWVLLNWKIKK